MIDKNRELKDFIHIVSHDIRAPIRHIKNFYDMLTDELNIEWSDEQKELKMYLEQAIETATEKMDRFVTYSRLFTEEVTSEDFSVNCLIQDIIDELTLSDSRLSTIKLDCQKNYKINSKKKVLWRACLEIIENAVIYSTPNEDFRITVELSRADDRLLITVIDHGIGIEEHLIENVAKPFTRLKAIDAPGVGMGLPIAKKAIDILAGHIQIKSHNKGCSVTMSIPVECS